MVDLPRPASRLTSSTALALLVALASTATAQRPTLEENPNPRGPYKLYVAESPTDEANAKSAHAGAERVLNVFAERNKNKAWRKVYDAWFVLVPQRAQAEIVLDINRVERIFVNNQASYPIFGKVTVPGSSEPKPIRGELIQAGESGMIFPEQDMLDRIIRAFSKTKTK